MNDNEYEMDECETGRCKHLDCAQYRIAVGAASPQDHRILDERSEEFIF